MELKERIQIILFAVGAVTLVIGTGFGIAGIEKPFVFGLLGGMVLVAAAAIMD